MAQPDGKSTGYPQEVHQISTGDFGAPGPRRFFRLQLSAEELRRGWNVRRVLEHLRRARVGVARDRIGRPS